MKSIMFSDLHLNNKMISMQKEFFLILIKEIKESNIKRIIFLGDMFHDRKKIDLNLRSFLLLLFFVRKAKKLGVEMLFMTGNHDKQNDKDQFGYLNLFSYFAKIFSMKKVYRIENMIFIPYFKSDVIYDLLKNYKYKKNIEYIFLHAGFDGVLNNGGMKVKDKKLNEDLFEGYVKLKKVFIGHYHNKQKLYNGLVNYIGNPMQLDHGEEEQKGYYIFDNEKYFLFYKKLELTKFITYRLECSSKNYNFAFKQVVSKENRNKSLRFVFSGNKNSILTIPKQKLEKISKCFNLKIERELLFSDMDKNDSILLSKEKNNVGEFFKEYSKELKMKENEQEFGLKKLEKYFG